jgi:hypothetical protein
MKMYLTTNAVGLISNGFANGFTSDARGTSWLTGFTLSAAPSFHSYVSQSHAPVTSGAGPQPFGRKHRF